jgi:hypothetical protein
MSLLIDTDAFCKLAPGRLLEAVPELFGLSLTDCARLPALPKMLRRGTLRRRLGNALCEKLIPVSERLARAREPSQRWLDLLAKHHDIDPGEARLIALVAERSDFMITGDKRALRAASTIPELGPAVAGKIAIVESVLLAACRKHGDDAVRDAVAEALPHDKMLIVCFSPGQSPRAALEAYLRDARSTFAPLELWDPPG